MTNKEIELKLCRENYQFFVCFVMWNVFKTKFTFYSFHKWLSSVMVSLTRGDRIIINCPPRLGKTVLAAQAYMAWRLLKDPTCTFIYLSYDQDLAKDKMQDTKQIVQWLANYFELPKLKLRHGRNTGSSWHTMAGGRVMAKGTGRPVTGYGCKTALIIDDPNKATDRNSAKTLATRQMVFTSTVRNRIDETGVPILVIQQRVAAKDLSGFLLEGGSGDQWTHYCKPALDENGDSICPERLPVEEIKKYESDVFTYNAQYLQVPLDDIGRLFNRKKIILAPCRPTLVGKQVTITVDTAAKAGDGNDFHAIAAIATDSVDYWVMDIENFHADVTELVERIRRLKAKYPSAPIVVEGRGSGNALIQLLQCEFAGVITVNPTKNKVERALVVKYLFDSMNVQFCCAGLIWGTVLAQFSSFPHVEHDDIVDCVVQGLTWLMQNYSALKNNNQDKAFVPLTRPKYNAGQTTLTRRSYNGTT